MNRKCFFALVLLSTLTVACAEEPHGSAHFAEANKAQIDLAISTSMNGPGLAVLAVLSAELDAEVYPACPTRTYGQESPRVDTYEADNCTSSDGTTYDGSLRATNVPSFSDVMPGDPGSRPAIDENAPMEIVFDRFRQGDSYFDGRVWFSAVNAGATGELELEYNAGTRVELDYVINCETRDDKRYCSPDGQVIIEGLGDFMLGGTTVTDAEGTIGGSLVLFGADTLTVDLDAMKDDCAPYTINGEPAGETCPEPVPVPVPEPATSRIDFYSIGCDSVEWSFEVTTHGRPTALTLELVTTERRENHPFSVTEETDAAGRHISRLDLVLGSEAEAGVASAFSCQDWDDLTFKFEATFEDGTSDCLYFGPLAESLADSTCRAH